MLEPNKLVYRFGLFLNYTCGLHTPHGHECHGVVLDFPIQSIAQCSKCCQTNPSYL